MNDRNIKNMLRALLISIHKRREVLLKIIKIKKGINVNFQCYYGTR